MVKSFEKLKKQAVRRTWLLAALFGGSSGVFVFGVLFTLFKLTGKGLPLWGCLAVGLAVVLAVGGVLTWILYPTTKRFARRLDKRYALEERVQTMVEYAEKESAVVQLQREDTEHSLSTLPKKKKSFFSVFKIVVAPVLAVAICSVSLALPQKEVPAAPPSGGVEEELPFDASKAIPEVERLIELLQASTLTEELKPAYVASLESLLSVLKAGTAKEGEVKTAVRATMDVIFVETTAKNTFNLFVREMKPYPDLKSLSKGLRNSRNAYETAKISVTYGDDCLEKEWTALQAGVQQSLRAYQTAMTVEMDALADEPAYVAYMTDYVDGLAAVLGKEGVAALPATDGVKRAITALYTAFQKTLTDLANPQSGASLVSAKGDVSAAVTTLGGTDAQKSATEALSRQAHSFMIKEYTLQRLAQIFDVAPPTEETDEDLGGSGSTGGGGAGGSGELNLPGSGKVYDPATGTYREYQDMLTDGGYYKNMLELIEEDEREGTNKFSDELKAYIKAYFNKLQVKE